MNYLQRLHVLFVSTLGMIVVWVGILGWAEVARGQASYEELHAFAPVGYSPYAGSRIDYRRVANIDSKSENSACWPPSGGPALTAIATFENST